MKSKILCKLSDKSDVEVSVFTEDGVDFFMIFLRMTPEEDGEVTWYKTHRVWGKSDAVKILRAAETLGLKVPFKVYEIISFSNRKGPRGSKLVFYKDA